MAKRSSCRYSPDTERKLRRIVDAGRGVGGRSLDRDFLLAQQYAADQIMDPAAVSAVIDPAADRSRYDELPDEYGLMNGGAPTTSQF